VKTEGQAEEVTYAKFESWCTNSIRSLDKAISDEKAAIDTLESKIESRKLEEKTLAEHITALEAEILKYQTADTAAEGLRQEEARLYGLADQDLDATITAIASALTELEGVQGSASLVQAKLQQLSTLPLVLATLTSGQQMLLMDEAQRNVTTRDILAAGDAQRHAKKYTFKSGGVIDLLKQLKLKFEDDRVEATKQETNSQNAYELAKNARASSLQAANKAKDEKNILLGDVQTELAADQSTLGDTKADLQADSTSLGTTQQSCDMKKSEWTQRSEIRARERKALRAGIDILSKVGGVTTAAPTNPVPPPSPVTLLLSAAPAPGLALLESADPKERAIQLLREEARKTKSRAFARFAEEIAAHANGPFDEVNNMIQKMIFRLMAEQKDEDDHKNWCDLELEKTNTSKANKEDKITNLNAKLTDARATVQLLANEITAAAQMAATITNHMKQATEVRKIGKEQNKIAVKDAKDAQAAIAQAEAVLLDFYKDTGMVTKEAWELLQKAPVTLPAEPASWGSSYTGVADPKNQPDGIITVLKQISADFATMEADTMAQEETDQNAYEQEIKASEIEKARRAKEAEMKAQEKSRLQEKIAAHEQSLKHVTDELGAVEQYLVDLGPACIQGDSTYEDRKGARASEIDALKQAQVFLRDWKLRNGQTSFLAPIKPAGFLSVKKP